MNKKHIKVAYTSRLSGGSYTQVPKIQMEGRWLEELGFSIGNTIVVEYGEGSLCIRPMTETELTENSARRPRRSWAAKPLKSENSNSGWKKKTRNSSV